MAIDCAQPGMELTQLNQVIEDKIASLGGGHSFKSVANYFWASCLTIDDEVVHGTPRRIKLKPGDLLSIDLGAVFPKIKGLHTDAAWSVVVAGTKAGRQKIEFLKVGEKTLWAAVEQAVVGNKVGDISATIQSGIEKAGLSVVKSLCGHGVGRRLHERPEIPGFGKMHSGVLLEKGMAIAIEVIYAQGKGEVYEKGDGWTVATADGSLGGLFEMSVVVDDPKPLVLTDWRSSSDRL